MDLRWMFLPYIQQNDIKIDGCWCCCHIYIYDIPKCSLTTSTGHIITWHSSPAFPSRSWREHSQRRRTFFFSRRDCIVPSSKFFGAWIGMGLESESHLLHTAKEGTSNKQINKRNILELWLILNGIIKRTKEIQETYSSSLDIIIHRWLQNI